MKFAFCLFKYFPYGGLQKKCLRIANACIARGHQVDIYTHHWEGEQPENITVTLIPTKGLSNHRKSLYFATSLQKTLSEHYYDCIVGFNRMPGLDVYYAGDDCFEYLARTNHGIFYRLTSRYRIYHYLEKAVFGPQSSTQIMYLSQRQAKHFTKYYNISKQRLTELPPGISLSYQKLPDKMSARKKIRNQLMLSDTDQLILLVGSSFRTKGVDRAIQAIASLPETLKTKTHLVIIGQGDASLYNQLINKLNINKQVHFLGPKQNIPDYLFAADLLIHPAQHESGGNILIEAMVCGLPSIVTASCGYSQHVQQANAGIIIPEPFSQNKLNKNLCKMLEDKEKKHWDKNARHYIQQNDVFSLVEYAADLIETCALEKNRTSMPT